MRHKRFRSESLCALSLPPFAVCGLIALKMLLPFDIFRLTLTGPIAAPALGARWCQSRVENSWKRGPPINVVISRATGQKISIERMLLRSNNGMALALLERFHSLFDAVAHRSIQLSVSICDCRLDGLEQIQLCVFGTTAQIPTFRAASFEALRSTAVKKLSARLDRSRHHSCGCEAIDVGNDKSI